MSKTNKLIELTTKKRELYNEISNLDLLTARKKDEYRKVVNEIRKLDKNYSSDTTIH